MSEETKSAVSKDRSEVLKLPYLVLSVTMLITLGATYFFYQISLSKDLARFNGEVVKTKTVLENKINTYISILKAGRGFIQSSETIDKKRFAAFVRNLDLEKNYPGLKAIGFVERVPVEARETFQKKMRFEGFEKFNIFPDPLNSEKRESFVVTYFEPVDEDNQGIVGFDMSSESDRLTAMNKARNSGAETITGKVLLIKNVDASDKTGFLIYLPVYKGDVVPPSIEERERNLTGFIFSRFKSDELLDEIQRILSQNNLAVTIYDTEISDDSVLLRTNSQIDKNTAFYSKNESYLANRKWFVEYQSLPGFNDQSTSGLTPLIFISGLVISLILFGMTYLESFARAASEKIADDLRESEKQKELLLESEQKAREIAENANQAKDEFIANVSHELRTPLNSIAGWSRILQGENVSPETRRQALQTIDRNLRIQTKIVEDLLDFSQMISEDQELNTTPIIFSDIFEQAFQEASATARDKEVALTKINHLNGEKISADAMKIKKVVKNLLLNAIKFTPPKGEVIAETKENDGMIELTVQDTGQGISPDFLPHIFESFKQADASITRKHGGLGLGLAASRKIVELLGGQIEVRSEGENKGTIFTVRLPFIKESGVGSRESMESTSHESGVESQ